MGEKKLPLTLASTSFVPAKHWRQVEWRLSDRKGTQKGMQNTGMNSFHHFVTKFLTFTKNPHTIHHTNDKKATKNDQKTLYVNGTALYGQVFLTINIREIVET